MDVKFLNVSKSLFCQQIAAIDVEGLKQLPMIQTLDLQNNSVAHVPPQLGTITTLKSASPPLKLSLSLFQTFPLSSLTTRHLQLGGNVFRNPRPAVLARGTADLLQYLRDRIPT